MHHALFLCSWWEFNEVSNFTKARKSHLSHSKVGRGNCRWTGDSMPSTSTVSYLTIMGWQFEGLNSVCISITVFRVLSGKRKLSLCNRSLLQLLTLEITLVEDMVLQLIIFQKCFFIWASCKWVVPEFKKDDLVHSVLHGLISLGAKCQRKFHTRW